MNKARGPDRTKRKKRNWVKRSGKWMIEAITMPMAPLVPWNSSRIAKSEKCATKYVILEKAWQKRSYKRMKADADKRAKLDDVEK